MSVHTRSGVNNTRDTTGHCTGGSLRSPDSSEEPSVEVVSDKQNGGSVTSQLIYVQLLSLFFSLSFFTLKQSFAAMVVCQYFQRGDCRFGDRCHFEHPTGVFVGRR